MSMPQVNLTCRIRTSRRTSQTNKTVEEKIIEFCKEPRTLAEIMAYLGYKDRGKFKSSYINPLLETVLAMTKPDKPNSRNQKYYLKNTKK